MTLFQYERKFYDELIDNWRGGSWKEYVKECYREYMDSIEEAKIAEWESRQ
jgi:hypothetical protein